TIGDRLIIVSPETKCETQKSNSYQCLPRFRRSVSSSRASHKSLRHGENVGYEFRRLRLGIDPQQRLGAGHPKQHPGNRAVAVFGAVARDIKEALYSVQPFLSLNGV